MSGETGIRDLLTGLYTREYFDEIIGRELERSRRHGIALTVLSLVVVNKKKLAETAGEEAADTALAEAAKTLQSHTRETDILFRWEEDELIALFFEADVASCATKVHQLGALFRPWREGKGPVPHAVKIRIGASTMERDLVFPAVLQAARSAARAQTTA